MFGSDFADLAVLDQHVRRREVADLAVEREHDAALDQDAARALHAGEIGVDGALRARFAAEHLRHGAAGCEPSARGQESAA